MFLFIILFVTYQVLQLLLLPFIIASILVIHAKKSIIGNWQQRIGLVPKTKKSDCVIWLHAVSVGEVLSIQECINVIKKQIPNAVCYVTIGTTAGMRIAQKQLKTDYLSFLPYDFLFSMVLAYMRIKPQALFIVEAELWPNLLGLARIQNIPRILLNARITPRSMKRLNQFKIVFKALFGSFNTILAQSEYDAALFSSLANIKQTITVLGNLKAFNVVEKKKQFHTNDPMHVSNITILLAGSIHPTEEIMYLELFKKLKAHNPKLKLILAPRHFGWQQKLIETVTSYGFSAFMWTEHNALITKQDNNLAYALSRTFVHHDVILVCKLGEMFALYPFADIYFLGGTFVPVGGHNLLEPAVWGIPTIIGPHYGNCIDIANRLESAQGLVKTQNAQDLFEKTEKLLSDQSLRNNVGQNSQKWVYTEAITVERVLTHVIQEIAAPK